MQFALVDTLYSSFIVDRPNYGCAMILGTLKDNQIPTKFFEGQANYLPSMFCEDAARIFDLLKDVESDTRFLASNELLSKRQNLSETEFIELLADNFHSLYYASGPRNYLNAFEVHNLNVNFNLIFETYAYHLRKSISADIPIIDHYVDKILLNQPDAVGFSIQWEFDIFFEAIARRLKEERPDLPIIVGGSLMSYLTMEQIIQNVKEDYIDYLIIGPGEKPLVRLLNCLDEEKLNFNIPNLVYTNQRGEVQFTPPEFLNELEMLPDPDYDQFNLDGYLHRQRTISVSSSRGCSWGKCNFCALPLNAHVKNKYICLLPDIFAAQIERLQKKYDPDSFFFNDQEISGRRLKRICEALNQRHIKIDIFTFARFDKAYDDEEMLRSLYEAGVRTIKWGLESGSDVILEKMNKGITVHQASSILRKAAKAGISNQVFLLLGFPGETLQTADKTFNFMENHADFIDYISISVYFFVKNSPIGMNPDLFGVRSKGYGNWEVKSGISQSDANKLYNWFIQEWIGKGRFSSCSNGKIHLADKALGRVRVHFIHSHKMISSEEFLRLLNLGIFGNLYLVMSGWLKDEEGKKKWKPININDTLFINLSLPNEIDFQENWLSDLYTLCDGTRKIDEVLTILSSDISSKQVLDFLKKNYEYFWVFCKRWNVRKKYW
jgi:radical SAM superfamily enzyme YgiQ (UPF0313 family)